MVPGLPPSPSRSLRVRGAVFGSETVVDGYKNITDTSGVVSPLPFGSLDIVRFFFSSLDCLLVHVL